MVAFAQASLPHLTPEQREILELRYLRHASIMELSQWLGISLRMVERRLKRAHTRLGIKPLPKRKTHKRRFNASNFTDERLLTNWL